MTWRFALSVVATALVFIGYVPYIRDVLRGKTKPHAYTWGMGLLVTAVSLWGLIVGQAGWAALVLFAIVLLTAVIFVLSLRYGVRKGTRLDNWCLGFCLLAFPLWVVTKSPVYAVVLLNLIDAVAFIPTLVKAYRHPYSETLFSYQMNVVRFGLLITALQNYSVLTLAYPVTWFVCNLLFVMVVTERRRLNPEGA
jgi:hypothetical protein